MVAFMAMNALLFCARGISSNNFSCGPCCGWANSMTDMRFTNLGCALFALWFVTRVVAKWRTGSYLLTNGFQAFCFSQKTFSANLALPFWDFSLASVLVYTVLALVKLKKTGPTLFFPSLRINLLRALPNNAMSARVLRSELCRS